jgi:hypothetical protein
MNEGFADYFLQISKFAQIFFFPLIFFNLIFFLLSELAGKGAHNPQTEIFWTALRCACFCVCSIIA